MNKEKALEDFFTSLNMSLRNASLYFKEHPLFIRSVREVKKRIDVLLDLVSPLKICFAPTFLIAEEKYFEKSKVFEELARIFHVRKIKSIEVRKGMTIEELIIFLTKVNLSPEIILKKGGLNSILKEEKTSHLAVEELDYSQLLMGEGEEIESIWPYLLQDAVEQEDFQKIDKFADNFDRFLQDFRAEDLVENDELKVNLNKLFTQLKSREEGKFRSCSRDLLKSIMKNNNIAQKIESSDTGMLFKELSNDDFGSVLWEELSTDDSFNPLNFQIFSQLAANKDQKGIADSFEKISREKRPLCHSSPVRKKIKELLTGSSDAVISKFYQKTLASLLRDISLDGELTFDHNLLQGNYRYMLLYLLNKEKEAKQTVHILKDILGEWESIVHDKDLEFIKCLISVLERKRSDLSYDPIFMKVNMQVLYFVAEYEVLQEDIPTDFGEVTNYLSETFLGIKPYLDKMFKEKKVSPGILQLFFQLYLESFFLFKKNLAKKTSDTDFLEEITKSLGKVDSPASLESLKCIFSFGNPLLKRKVLESIESLSIQDEDFLFGILKERGMALKKKALQILIGIENNKKKMVEELFSIFSPFGLRNGILLENIKIIEEMGLKEARGKMIALSQQKSLWNKKLRGETLKVLEDWDAGIS